MGRLILKFTIPLTPISKKNSQQILVNRRTNRPFVMPSKQYKKYELLCKEYIPKIKTSPINYPVNVDCKFYMPTKRKCDLCNLLESIDDILTKYKIIDDDNYTIVAGHDGSRILYDKENPRTEVVITRMEDETN